ncbi:hypothetical protein [Hungatella hathewayi]|uniref:hypothetical protein n=1 Tax=Hungatella hathewayi TaxID=154046 RepID=UPI003566096E
MGIPAHYIKDKNGEKFYPFAHVNAIYDNEGNLLKDSPVSNKFREYPSFSSFPALGEKGVAYIDTDNNTIYRWDSTNSKYINIGSSLHLGMEPTDAGRGDWTKAAYDHSQSIHAPDKAQENIIEKITVAGIAQTIENKTVNLPKYPTTLPASDVYPWAKSQTKPSYTKTEVGLSDVPNVTTNDQTPTFTQASTLSNIISGEKITVMFGKIAKALIDFIAHKSDTVIHIAGTERTNWNNAHTHISDAVKHITAGERNSWNTVTNKVDKVTGKYLSTNDYTTIEKNKLAGITSGAEVNVQADWNIVDENSDAYIKNKPSAMPASDVLAWAKAANKPAYSWTEITNRPTKISQFTNDSGYITQADVDTTQNHTHTNKTVLDKITQSLLDTWNGKAGTSVATQAANGLMAAADKKKLDGVASGANNYVHSTASGYKHIPAGGASGQFLKWSADGTAVWAADNNTTYLAFKAATASAAGGVGLVPAPAAGAQAKYLRADGSWETPQDTKYTHPNSGATAGTYHGVTINAQGHVTAGSNPTTLSGYGISDAATSSSVSELTKEVEVLKNGVEIDGGGASTTDYENEYDGGGAVE